MLMVGGKLVFYTFQARRLQQELKHEKQCLKALRAIQRSPRLSHDKKDTFQVPPPLVFHGKGRLSLSINRSSAIWPVNAVLIVSRGLNVSCFLISDLVLISGEGLGFSSLLSVQLGNWKLLGCQRSSCMETVPLLQSCVTSRECCPTRVPALPAAPRFSGIHQQNEFASAQHPPMALAETSNSPP